MGVETARIVQNKLIRGLLDFMVMEFLRAQPMHGYQIITRLRKKFGVYFGPSTIYPLLTTMEKQGYIKGQWDLENERPRKVYAITSEGNELLKCTEDSLTHILRKLETASNKTQLGKRTREQVPVILSSST